MKKISSIILTAILALGIFSCKKDENKVIFRGGTPPVLTSSVTGSIPLSYTSKDNQAIKLLWTNPNYQFNTGISSLNVNYNLEIDTMGANFTNPNREVISLGTDLSKTLLQSELNDYLLNQLQLKPAVLHNIEIRVTGFLVGGSEPLASNVLSFKVTPYAIPPKVTPPASGELYITGNAVASDWTNTPPASQKFTQVSPTFYTLNVNLTGGNSYTFLPTYGSWNDKYSIATKNDPNEIYGGDFQWQGNDILAPPVSGNYKIDVDFQRGKFAVTKL